jgi:uncharacterized membrane protein
MLGFFIGTACLVGFIAVARRSHHHYRGWGGRGHRGHARRFIFRRVLSRLDTTPGQEKVIRSAVNDFKDEAFGLRSEVRSTRAEIAAALRPSELDKAALDRAFAKHDEVLERLRSSFVNAADQIHGTLDDRQRKQLADMIDAGPWGFAGC